MCGICGVVGVQRPDTAGQVRAMVAALRHRGPDANAVWACDFARVGHTRLAIIDLDPTANQPFVDEERGLTIVFNGEIYNYLELRAELVAKGYRPRTQSDTEILLLAYDCWGLRAFDRFIGMWAFCIVDARRREVILCRDRFGIKPLYYSVRDGQLLFASEPRALLAAGVSNAPNSDIVVEYLRTGATETGTETFFAEVASLPAASYLHWQTAARVESLSPVEFWNPLTATDAWNARGNYDDAVRAFRSRFEDAIRLHLRSDVPVGMCLSGGIDSSAIAGVSARFLSADGVQHPQTFSAVFPGEVFDESPFVMEVVDRYGFAATFVTPSRADFAADIDAVIEAQQEPVGSTGIYLQWKLFQSIAAAKLKVVLDGQGSDEYLGGYLTFLPSFIRSASLAGRMSRLASSGVPLALANAPALIARFGSVRRLAAAADRHRRKGPAQDWLLSPQPVQQPQVSSLAPALSPFKRMLVDYLQRRSLPSLLRYEDRNSMAFSIESRVPFLDHRLVEFALGVPDDFLLREGRTKSLLRDAVRADIPHRVWQRRLKLGFASPQEEWTRKVLIDRLPAVLEEHEIQRFVNARVLLGQLRSGGEHLGSDVLWRLYNLGRWLEIFSAPSARAAGESHLMQVAVST